MKVYGETSTGLTDREICRNSVLLSSKLGKVSLNPDLKCQTKLVHINTDDKQEVMRGIADELYWCWYMFGEGKINFGDNWEFLEGENGRFACSVITFGEKTKNLKSISAVEFRDFLMDPENSKSPGGESYWDYFSKGFANLIDKDASVDGEIDLTKDYFVFFGYLKDMDSIRQTSASVWGAGIGTLLGGWPIGTFVGTALGYGIDATWQRIYDEYHYVPYLGLDKEAEVFKNPNVCKSVIA